MAIARDDGRFFFEPDPCGSIRDAIEAVKRPVAEARGLPNMAYVDPRLFAVERDRVMAPTWACLGFADDTSQPGQVKPLEFMGLPLVQVCNQQGEVKVFHNVCSHRGMQLVREETHVRGVLRCPYHSWAYDLDGCLKGTPHIGGVGSHTVAGMDPDRHGLRQVRSATWLGMVFVNLSGTALPFAEHVAPLQTRWQELTGPDGFQRLRHVGQGGALSLEVACNWKLAVENYCESYHLPWVHPSLNSYSRLEDHYNLLLEGPFAGQASRAYNLAEVAGTRLPRFPHWPADRLRHAEYISFYPNLLLGLQADHVLTLLLEPVSEGITREHLRIHYVGDEATQACYADARAATLEAWRTVFSEDIDAVEGLQRGRRSTAFGGGVFSPVMDTATHHFHRWVAERLTPTEQRLEAI